MPPRLKMSQGVQASVLPYARQIPPIREVIKPRNLAEKIRRNQRVSASLIVQGPPG